MVSVLRWRCQQAVHVGTGSILLRGVGVAVAGVVAEEEGQGKLSSGSTAVCSLSVVMRDIVWFCSQRTIAWSIGVKGGVRGHISDFTKMNGNEIQICIVIFYILM